MTFISGKRKNPELEALRNSVKPPPHIDSRIEELIRKTRDIHAAFLFGPEGKQLRKELCLTLSSTQHSPIYSGWEDFGHDLGLDPRVINYIGLGLLREDPTYYVLRVNADNEFATVASLIEALRRIKRPDVIIKNCDLINDLADGVHRKYRISEESGYLSLSEGTVESSTGSSEDDIQQNIIRYPFNLPTVPSILSLQSIEIPERCTNLNIQVQHAKQEEQLVRAAPCNIKTRVTTQKIKYGLKVMLTFASDGYDAAKEVAKIMRENRDGFPRIGVVMLEEQIAALTQDDQMFITMAFQQVDYVIPIITEEYLIRTKDINNYYANTTCLDARYVRYIYALMNTNYVSSGCINKKCRCIIPDEFVHSVLNHPSLKSEPLFKVWQRLSQTEEFRDKLLLAALRKRTTTNSSS